MRALFGIVSLLVVLAIVGLVTVKQMKAVSHVGSVSASAAAAADLAPMPPLSASGNVRDQSRQIEKQVADDVAKALREGAARTGDADKP